MVVGSLQVEHASHPVDRRRRLFASFEVNGFVRRFGVRWFVPPLV